MSRGSGSLIGVVGGSGGIGASTFAAGLACAAGDALLIDVDAIGGGIDVLLGIEAAAGARWSAVRVGGGHLDPGDLRRGLPLWRGGRVLALDGAPPPVSGVVQVLDAWSSLGAVVAADLGRAATPVRQAVAERADLVVLIAAAHVRDVAAARRVLAGFAGLPVGLVVRRGAMGATRAAELIGAPLLGVLPARGMAPAAGSASGGLARVAGGILDGVLAGPPQASCSSPSGPR